MIRVLGLLCLWTNPLFVKGVRSRLRLRHVVVGGTITFVIAAFLFFFVYLGGAERHLVEPETAAKATMIPLLIFQGILLMLMGTGSVASGIAVDRDSGILDFHRLTPMPAARKIVGCLFGLPVREYFLFAMTLPFVGLAVVLGGIPVLKVLHLYVVFFSAVVLYHLTGFVSGMIAAKPRRASWIAQVAIVALYLFLPRLSNLGFTVFGYLTIVPAFRQILAAELDLSRRQMRRVAEASGLAGESDVPFFTTTVDPTVYTLLLQGALAATFFVIVHRKWCREGRQAFSQRYAVAFFAGLQVLLVGSLWPFLTGDRELNILRSIPRALRQLPQLQVILAAFTFLSAAAAAFLLHVVTPTRHAMLAGLRRARAAGAAGGVPAWSDASSSARVALAFAVLAAAGHVALLRAVLGSGTGFEAPPPWIAQAAPVLLLAMLLVCAQAAREIWSPRWSGLFLFLVWLAPTLAYLVVLAAWGATPLAAALTISSPFTSLYFAVDALMAGAAAWRGTLAAATGPPHLDPVALTWTAWGVHGTLAVVLTVLRVRAARAREREADRERGPQEAVSSLLA